MQSPMEETTKKLITYFQAWKDKFPDAQMMFTGCAPWFDDMKAYAEKHDLVFANSGCCSSGGIAKNVESGFDPIELEYWIVNTDPEIVKTVLERVQEHFGGKFYIYFGPAYIDMHPDGYEQHSYVFEDCPENWINEMLAGVALARMAQIVYENFHRISTHAMIRYDWQYNKELEKFERRTSDWKIKYTVEDDSVTRHAYRRMYDNTKSAITYALWLKKYFAMFENDPEMLHFTVLQSDNDYCDGTLIMKREGIMYTCNCDSEYIREIYPPPTEESYAELQAHAKRIYAASVEAGHAAISESFEKLLA